MPRRKTQTRVIGELLALFSAYIAAYLAVAVFRMERMPSLTVMLATVLATAGVVMTAFG